MGLMEDLGAWLDQKRRNVASSVQNPGLLYTRMNEDARQFQQDQRANWGDVKSVVPEVKAAGIKELNASGQELGGLLGTISAKQAKQIIKQTKKFGGSTTDATTGENPLRGYAVAVNPPGGLVQNTVKMEDLTPRDIMDFERRNRGLLKGRNVGTWNDNGTVYLDASEVVKAPFKARLEGQRRDQLAVWDLLRGKNEYPSLEAQGRMAMRDAADKTGLLRQDKPIAVPDGPEFWPWRVQHGGYEADKDDKGWFVKKVMSPEEKKLQAAIKDAEQWVDKPGNNVEVWPLDQLKRPAQQNERLQYATRPKGVP
jgi:hypothetical protein